MIRLTKYDVKPFYSDGWGVDEGGQKWYFKSSDGIRAFHEWIAFRIGTYLDLPMTEVQIATMDGSLGVSIKDIGEFTSYYSFPERLHKEQFDHEVIRTTALFDMLLCHNDRHDANWFLKMDNYPDSIRFILLDHDDVLFGVHLYLDIKERDRQMQLFRCYGGYPGVIKEIAESWKDSKQLQTVIQTDWEGVLKQPCLEAMAVFPRWSQAVTKRAFQLIRLRQERIRTLKSDDPLYKSPKPYEESSLREAILRLW